MGEVGRRLGLTGAVETGMLWRRWREVVGEAIAEHAEPTSLRDGVLRVRADSPAWANELSYLGPEIVRRANELTGHALVTEMKVWTGPGKVTDQRGERRSAGRSQADREQGEDPRNVDPQEALAAAYRAWHRRRRGAR